MIDTTSLTALISAFRAEVTQNSISPEKVGGILQSIVNVLSTSVAENDIKDFTSIREALKKATTMYLSLTQGTSDRNHVYLTPTLLNATTGEKYTNADSIRIQQATTERAGAMRAQQVIDLNTAKKNITDLQDEVANLGRVLDAVGSRFNILSEQIDGIKNTDLVALSENIADLRSLLETLDTEMGEAEDDIIVLRNDINDIQDIRTISVDVKDRFLILQGAAPLLERKLIPYLFRLTKKANRKRYKNSAGVRIRKKNRPRKGWHLMGNRTTLNVDATTFEVSINTTVHGNDKREASYSYHPMDFIKLSNDLNGHKQVAYGKRLISLWNEEKERERKVSLKYGIAFGYKITGDGLPTNLLCTNIAEFSVVYDPKSRSWSFSK